MPWSDPTCSRKPRLPNGSISMAGNTGWALVELGCWILSFALIATYLVATSSLENQRRQGIELFAQAQATAMDNQRLEVLPLADQGAVFPSGQDATPAPAPEVAADAASLPIAVLRIAKVDLEVPVYSDPSELNLSRGAGWIGGTAAPNASGNMAIAAHRDRYFRPLKDVQVGDTVELESLGGHGEYRVSRIAIVDPDEVSVLDDTLVPTITLITCYPFYFIGNAPQRYIVQAIAVDHPGKASLSDAIHTAISSGETQ